MILKNSRCNLASVFFIVFLGFSGCSQRSTLEDGIAAYEARDLPRAIKILSPLGEAGNLLAQKKLGMLYSLRYISKGSDESVPSPYADPDKALYWFSKAVEQGDVDAIVIVGNHYDQGVGVLKNKDKAFEYWERAAKVNGYEHRLLAEQLMEAKRYKKAFYWLSRLAEQGDAESQRDVCWMYLEGNGVHQDFIEARKWCEKSAAQGNSGALSALGEIYENGKGVSPDPIKAHMYYNLSRENISSKLGLGNLERSMSQAQILEAQALARNWKSSTVRQ